MQYSIAWQEFIPIERMNILKDLIGTHLLSNERFIDIPDTLSTGELEAVKFLCDPTTPVKFHIFDKTFGKILLQVHTEFWNFYFNR